MLLPALAQAHCYRCVPSPKAPREHLGAKWQNCLWRKPNQSLRSKQRKETVQMLDRSESLASLAEDGVVLSCSVAQPGSGPFSFSSSAPRMK